MVNAPPASCRTFLNGCRTVGSLRLLSSWRTSFAALLFLTAGVPDAAASPLLAGDVLRVAFDLASGLAGYPPAVQTPYGQSFAIPEQADVFGLSVLVNSGSGVNTFTARLFDGDRLLGTSTIPAAPLFNSRLPDYANFYFASPASLLAGADVARIDFSAFTSGSIAGVVEVTLDAGQVDYGKGFGINLFLGRAVGSREAYGFRVFQHGVSPVPEPASLLLVGAGIAALGARGRRAAGRRHHTA